MKNFIKNYEYYRVTYADCGMLYPNIASFLFEGTNLIGDEKADTWYFRSVETNKTYKTISDVPSDTIKYRCLTDSELSEMCSLEELITILQDKEKERAQPG